MIFVPFVIVIILKIGYNIFNYIKRSNFVKLSEIMKGITYTGLIKDDVEITDIIYDSRKAHSGTVFVCLSGLKLDGHKFARGAYDNGARVFIAERDIPLPDDAQILVVENSRAALGAISAEFFCHPAEKLKIIGITGTKGKTTTAHLVQKILNESGIPCGIIGTVGAEFCGVKFPTENTTPESYELQKLFRQMLDRGCEAIAVEVSSLGLKHGRVDGIRFCAGVFTNLSPDHIGPLEHEDMSEYAYWKSVLFERCDTAVMNYDDEAHTIMAENCRCRIISYGVDSSYDIYAKNIEAVRNSDMMGISFDCFAFAKQYKITAPIPGTFNVYNNLAALGAAYAAGCPLEHAAQALKNIKISGRAEIADVDAPFDVIIDYAHNGLSLKSILETLYTYKTGRIICVFGSVGGRTKERRREMGLVAGSMCELCVLTADNPDFEDPMSVINDIARAVKEAGGHYHAEPDRRKAIEYALSAAQEGDLVLLAGKGHENYQLINGVKEPFSELECIEDYMRRKSNND